MADNVYWVWLAECLGPACRDLEALLNQFGSPYEIFSAGESAYYHIPGVSEKTAEKLCRARSLQHAEQIIEQCSRLGIEILPYGDPAYPARLRTLTDPPTVLYYRGTLPDFDRLVGVAVVGTRSMSEYGGRTAYKISYELASAGAVVISGMALGIDGVAQCAAIAAGGETVAVLGSGVDVVYPADHRTLYGRIIRQGAVISEYPPGTRLLGAHFPVRNRIVSGLSRAVLVVEADLHSGAMITARTALAQGRELFAVPGNIGSFHAEGANALIHAGANFVHSTMDILDSYRFLFSDVLDLRAYAAAVERSAFDVRALDEMHVSARAADFKQRRGKYKKEFQAPSAIGPASPPSPSGGSGGASRAAEKDEPTVRGKTPPSDAPEPALTPECRRVWELIPEDRAVSGDALISAGISPVELTVALTELELLGLIEGLPGNLYIRTA